MRFRLAALAFAVGVAFAPRGYAQEIELKGQIVQGGLLVGKVPAGTRVMQDGKSVAVAADGHFLLGFGRDAASTSTVIFRQADGRERQRVLRVQPREYDIQRIDGLPRRQVTPSPEDLKRIRQEGRLMAAARRHRTASPHFTSGFDWPAIGRISGVYGSQRILNGKPRRPHFGVDVAAPIGTRVRAPADGIVRLTHPGMFFNGKTIVLDHGHGLNSVFIHLNGIVVGDGDRVRKGALLGQIGKTGRATGPHLHWAVRLGKVNIDPELLVPAMKTP